MGGAAYQAGAGGPDVRPEPAGSGGRVPTRGVNPHSGANYTANKIRCQQKTNLPVWVKISHFPLSKILQSDRLTLFRWSRPQPRRPRAGGGRGEADAAWAGVATRAACGARAPRRTRGGALEGKPGQGPCEEANGPGTTRAARAQEPLTQRGGGATTSSRTPPARTAAQHSAHAAGVKMTCSIESL